jgi:hypothetical protein
MRGSRALLKWAAVGCSVLLAAGFVSYRAGAVDWLSPPPPTAPEDGAAADDATPTPTPEQDMPAATPLTPPAVLYSSKSGAIIVPPTQASPSKPAPIMGGSKSISPLIPPSTPTPPVSQSPAPPK